MNGLTHWRISATSDIDRKGGATDTYYLVWTPPWGGIDKTEIDLETAMTIARQLDEGERGAIEVAAVVAEIAYLEERNAESEAKDPDGIITNTEVAGVHYDSITRRDLIAARRAAISVLRGQPDTTALLDERAKLVARLAEIDTLLNAVRVP